jgi:glycine cleavage system H protein
MSKINPPDRKYSPDHEWIMLNGLNSAFLGITDYAQEMLTNIVYVELPEIGRKVKAGDSIATVESVKSVSDVYSPVGGEVVDVNRKLETAPDLINNDAFGEGWIVQLKIANMQELDTLMGADEYGMSIIGDKN